MLNYQNQRNENQAVSIVYVQFRKNMLVLFLVII